MSKFKITENCSETVFYEIISEIEAESIDDAEEKYKEGLPDKDYIVISKTEVERESNGYNEIEVDEI